MRPFAGFVLLTCIAVGSVGNGLEERFAVGADTRIDEDAELYRFDFGLVEDVGIFSVSPQQDFALFVYNALHVGDWYSNRGQLIAAIWPDNRICQIDWLIRLAEVQITRDAPLKILDRVPGLERGRSSCAKIVEGGNKIVSIDLPICFGGRDHDSALDSYDGTQLFSCVDLRFVGDAPLLINEKESAGIGEEQQTREPSNRSGPFDQIPFKTGWGLICFAASAWLSCRSIWHGIFSDNKWACAIIPLLPS